MVYGLSLLRWLPLAEREWRALDACHDSYYGRIMDGRIDEPHYPFGCVPDHAVMNVRDLGTESREVRIWAPCCRTTEMIVMRGPRTELELARMCLDYHAATCGCERMAALEQRLHWTHPARRFVGATLAKP